MSATNYCTCGASRTTGYKKQGDDWVCASCKLPSKIWLETITFPRILLGEKFPDLREHVKTFMDRMNARFDMEVESLKREYPGLPEKTIRAMLKASDIEGTFTK